MAVLIVSISFPYFFLCMSVYTLVILNDILAFHIERKNNFLEIFLSIWPNATWGLQQLEDTNRQINQVQLQIQEQICLLAVAGRPPPPA